MIFAPMVCVPSTSWGNLGHCHRSSPPQEQIFRGPWHMCSTSFERKSWSWSWSFSFPIVQWHLSSTSEKVQSAAEGLKLFGLKLFGYVFVSLSVRCTEDAQPLANQTKQDFANFRGRSPEPPPPFEPLFQAGTVFRTRSPKVRKPHFLWFGLPERLLILHLWRRIIRGPWPYVYQALLEGILVMVIVLLLLRSRFSEDHDHMCSTSFERKSWSWSSSFSFPIYKLSGHFHSADLPPPWTVPGEFANRGLVIGDPRDTKRWPWSPWKLRHGWGWRRKMLDIKAPAQSTLWRP